MIDFLALPFQLDFSINIVLIVIISIILTITSIMLAQRITPLQSVVIMSIFSVFLSIYYLLMDAPDVAMTETALGACLSTCVLLNILNITGNDKGKVSNIRIFLSSILCLIFIIFLSWASLDLPEFGKEDTAMQSHLTKYYIENTKDDIGIPSYVAAILASYRGYDTLGETSVILIAGLAVFVILSRKKRNEE